MKRGFTVIELIIILAPMAAIVVIIYFSSRKDPIPPFPAKNCTWVERTWAVCSVQGIPHMCTEKGCSPLVIPPAEKGN